MRPSTRIRDPVPALSRGSSSRTTIVSTTALRARPPRRRIAKPRAPAATAASWTDASDPAPQCARRRGRNATGTGDVRFNVADHRARLSRRSETGCEVRDALPKFIANRAQFVHRLAGRPGNRPVLRFLLRTDRATVEATERDDAGRALNQLGRCGSRRLRAELQPHLL